MIKKKKKKTHPYPILKESQPSFHLLYYTFTEQLFPYSPQQLILIVLHNIYLYKVCPSLDQKTKEDKKETEKFKPWKLERAMRLSSSFFLLTLVFLFIFPAATSCCTKLIDETCKNSSHNDSNFSYRFCKTSLQAAPASRCASLRGLGLIAIRLFRDNATDTRCFIRELLGKKGLDTSVKMRLEDCLDMYSDGVESLTQAIKGYRAGEYFDANVQVSGAMTYASTCEDGFQEKEGLVSPLTKQNDDAFQLGALSLSIMNKQKWFMAGWLAGFVFF